MRLSRCRTVYLGAAVGCWSGSAWAQDADTFNPSGSMWDGRGTLQLASPTLGAPNAWYGAFGFGYAKSPLILVKDGETETIVGGQVLTHLAAGKTWKDDLRLDLDLPIYPSVKVGEESHFAMGDIRLGSVLPLYSDSRGLFDLGLAPALRLPTAGKESYLTNGGMGLEVTAAMGGAAGNLGWIANLGCDLSKKISLKDQVLGSALLAGGGLTWALPDDLRLGAEITSRVNLASATEPAHDNPVEMHLFGTRALPSGLALTGAMGTGLVGGVGAPKVRLFLGLAYQRPPTVAAVDQDGDGIIDASDKCPTTPEDRDGYQDEDGCPDLDNDLDGLKDPDDACPNEPGPSTTRGCPDTDGDGVADNADLCKTEPGPSIAGGCPDRDGDRVPDMRDKCPDEAADPRVDPSRSDGCPSRVFVSKEKIEILEKVFFDTNKDTIKAVSFPLLLEVAKVMNDTKDIKLVEIQGHTDSTATDDYNLELSQKRAEAVMRFLTEQGKVEAARLVAKGYGETRPIDTNLTEEGKANNRRVEFVILNQ